MAYEIENRQMFTMQSETRIMNMDVIVTQSLNSAYEYLSKHKDDTNYANKTYIKEFISTFSPNDEYLFNKISDTIVDYESAMDALYLLEDNIFSEIKTNTNNFIDKYFAEFIADPTIKFNLGVLGVFCDVAVLSKLENRAFTEREAETEFLLGYLYYEKSEVRGIQNKYVLDFIDIEDLPGFVNEIEEIKQNRELYRNVKHHRTWIVIESLSYRASGLNLVSGINIKAFVMFALKLRDIINSTGYIISLEQSSLQELFNDIMWEVMCSIMYRDTQKSDDPNAKLNYFKNMFHVNDLVLFSGAPAEVTLEKQDNVRQLKPSSVGLAYIKGYNDAKQTVILQTIGMLKTTIEEMSELELPITSFIPNDMSLSEYDKKNPATLALPSREIQRIYILLPAGRVYAMMYPEVHISLPVKSTERINAIERR